MRYFIIIGILISVLAGCDSRSGQDAITSRGTAVLNDCTACHTGSAGIAPNPLTTNGTGTAGKHVAHVTSAGLECGWCHFDFASNPGHTSGTGSTVIFDPVLTGATWSLITGGPTPTGNCTNVSCHMGTTPPTPNPLNWYGPDITVPAPACSVCHNKAQGTRRQVMGSAGDFGANPAILSRHVATTVDPTPGQCLVCHDMSQHRGGTVRLVNADTGTTVPFNASAPSSLEPFCLSCHDANGAAGNLSPFGDGMTLGTVPYVASTTVASSWSGSSTHRSKGLTCAGTGAANTGCHGTMGAAGSGAINMHGSTVRGLLANNMNFQITLESSAVYAAGRALASSYSESNYKLCFDCHANYPAVTKEVVLGSFTSGTYDIFESPALFNTAQTSSFRDYYNGTSVPFYSDTMWGYPRMALHNYHLIGFENRPIFVSAGVNALQWLYRGDTNRAPVRITCTACHSVHGTAGPTIRSTYPEFGLLQFNDVGNLYVTLGTGSLSGSPSNCTINCHGAAWPDPSAYWKSPAGE